MATRTLAPWAAASSAAEGSRRASASFSAAMPRPWAAAISSGSPRPKPAKSASTASGATPSTLLATSTMLAPRRRSAAAISSSPPVRPARASTSHATRSASAMAASACSVTRSESAPSAPKRPPVSTSVTPRPPMSARAYCRSRVRPGRFATKALRVAARRLKSVDLPTLGRPTKATIGMAGGAPQLARRLMASAVSWPPLVSRYTVSSATIMGERTPSPSILRRPRKRPSLCASTCR